MQNESCKHLGLTGSLIICVQGTCVACICHLRAEWNSNPPRWVQHIIYSGWNHILQCNWSADCPPLSQKNWCPNNLREHFTSAWCGIGRMLNWSSLCGGEWPSHREWKQHSSTLEKPIVRWNWQFFNRKT
jgi:hypothetical protein